MPNPWIAIPSLAAAVIGGVVGFVVTDASCVPESCAASSVFVAVAAALAAGVGVAVVAVLAVRSLSEWRHHSEREIVVPATEDPGPPRC